MHDTADKPRAQGSIEPGRIRATKREAILAFFVANLGTKFPTDQLHNTFGTSFRTRASEINRCSAYPIRIHNLVERLRDGAEQSWYWSTPKPAPPIAAMPTEAQETLFDLARYPD